MNNSLIVVFKKCIRMLNYLNHNPVFQPKYRILGISEDEAHNHPIHINIINTKLTFYTTPQEILEDDQFVDLFSPRDVRTLTYLALNQPKYSIVGQRILDSNKLVFAIKQRGESKIIIKKASEILKEQNIVPNMSASDAIKIGYALASNDYN